MLFCCTQRSSTPKHGADYTQSAVLWCSHERLCVQPRVSDLSEVYKSTDAFGHLQFLASVYWLRHGTFSGTQLWLSLSHLGSKSYCSPGNKRPGVRVTSVISQGALPFPIVTTSLGGTKTSGQNANYCTNLYWEKAEIKTCFGLRYKGKAKITWQVYSSCCKHEALCQSDTTCERYI